MFSYFLLAGTLRGKIGKSDWFPKIPNFCCTELPLAKTYWTIVSPQKRASYNSYLPKTPILSKLSKNEF